MARTQAIKNYNDLLRGLITEGNEYNPPEGAFKDSLNIELVRTGGVRRRLGLNKSTGWSEAALAATGGGINWSFDVWDWERAEGDDTKNYTIVQMGQLLYFWNKGAAYSFYGSVSLASLVKSGTPWTSTPNEQTVNLIQIGGNLLVTGRHIYPCIISSYLTKTSLSAGLRVRDFQSIVTNPVLADDHRQLVFKLDYTTQTANFTVGATLSGVTSLSTARIVKDVDAGTTGIIYFALISGAGFLPTEIITDSSGGSATCSVTYSGSQYGLTNSHIYNLLNRGWTIPLMDTYAAATLYWPSLNQTWYAGKDATTGVFTPSLLDKIIFGNNSAATGHYILNLTKKDRATASGLSGLSNVVSDSEPALAAAYGGRVFYSGIENYLFNTKELFSLIISDIPSYNSEIFDIFTRCYQKNDPTVEISNQLLANDGGTLTIPDMGKPVKFVNIWNKLLLFCNNGIWAITGGTTDAGFSADSFQTLKISDMGTVCGKSIVITDSVEAGISLVFWNNQSIYACSIDANNNIIIQDIISNSIKTLFDNIAAAAKIEAKGYYDAYDNKVYWAYKKDTTLNNGKYRDAILILDLTLKAFYPYQLEKVNADKNLDPTIVGFTQDSFTSGLTTKPTLQVQVIRHSVSDVAVYATQTDFSSKNFKDFEYWTSGTYFASYMETWGDRVGDPIRDKQPIYVFTYFKKTEDGFVDNGSGGLIPKNPSSCLMSIKWDWHTTTAGGKITTPRQVYRFQRPYVPVDINDTFNTGESVIETKNKAKGKGKAVTYKFESENGKDFRLLGYSVPYE